MHGRLTPCGSVSIYLILLIMLAACADSRWRRDPAVEAARKVCRSQSGLDYNCVEGQAVAAANPDICRLAGIYIDDMCLQAVYEAADDPAICDRIYLRGVVPNCVEYYAHYTPAAPSPAGNSALPTQTHGPFATSMPASAATPTSVPRPTTTPTPRYEMDLSGYDPDLYQPIDISHNPP